MSSQLENALVLLAGLIIGAAIITALAQLHRTGCC